MMEIIHYDSNQLFVRLKWDTGKGHTAIFTSEGVDALTDDEGRLTKEGKKHLLDKTVFRYSLTYCTMKAVGMDIHNMV